MKKEAKELVKLAQRFGYVQVASSDRRLAYQNPFTGHVVHINPSTDSHGAGAVRLALQKANGAPSKQNKRNVSAIKDRRARDRARAAEEINRARARLDSLLAARDAALLAIETAESRRHIAALESKIAVADEVFRYWDRLMRETPSSGDAA